MAPLRFKLKSELELHADCFFLQAFALDAHRPSARRTPPAMVQDTLETAQHFIFVYAFLCPHLSCFVRLLDSHSTQVYFCGKIKTLLHISTVLF